MVRFVTGKVGCAGWLVGWLVGMQEEFGFLYLCICVCMSECMSVRLYD